MFSGEMVRAILAGRKTQTRRMMAPTRSAKVVRIDGIGLCKPLVCPYGESGDRLWVRETFHSCGHCGAGAATYRAGGWIRRPRVDGPDQDDHDDRPLNPKCAAHGWRPSIHMPRWASRITLEVVSVRAQRLHDISEEDARAEGVERVDGLWRNYMPDEAPTCASARNSFASLWDSINGKDPAKRWEANPVVWTLEFRRVEP